MSPIYDARFLCHLKVKRIEHCFLSAGVFRRLLWRQLHIKAHWRQGSATSSAKTAWCGPAYNLKPLIK